MHFIDLVLLIFTTFCKGQKGMGEHRKTSKTLSGKNVLFKYY